VGWTVYAASLAVGAGVGAIYGLLGVHSPAPPLVALLGLLGMLGGERLVAYWCDGGSPPPAAHAPPNGRSP
jgi:XapX domain-containing protein